MPANYFIDSFCRYCCLEPMPRDVLYAGRLFTDKVIKILVEENVEVFFFNFRNEIRVKLFSIGAAELLAICRDECHARAL